MGQVKSGLAGCLGLLILTCTASGQTQSPSELKVGGPAPELQLSKLFQAPQDANIDSNSLRGKVVVLEFWATWCAPCIVAMPHLNELADKFKDRPVRFISITDENESVVAPFLKRRQIKTWVGLDVNRSTEKSYSVKFLPTTIVIDQEGKIAAIIQPKMLSETLLSDILNGKSTGLAQETTTVLQPAVQKPPAQDAAKPLLGITIERTRSGENNWSMYPGRFKGQMTLKTALAIIHGISETLIVGPSLLTENRYDISASMTEGNKDALKSVLAQAIEASFKLRIHREMRELEVFVLTAPPKNELRQSSSESAHWSSAEGVLAASGAPLKNLVDGIAGLLGRPVVDETDLKGKYDWDILFDAKNPESIVDAIRKDVGLELKRAKRQIEALVVEIQ